MEKENSIADEMKKDSELQQLMENKLAKAGDFIRAYKDGKMDKATCVGLLMIRCHRSYETALLNIKLSEEYGSTSNIPFTGYGKKCEHHPEKPSKRIASDVYMDRSRDYNPCPEMTGMFMQVEVG